MQNPYEENPDTRNTDIKKGLTWAEYSIIVALLCIVGAAAYGWHVKEEVAAVKVELATKHKELKEAQDIIDTLRAATEEQKRNRGFLELIGKKIDDWLAK